MAYILKKQRIKRIIYPEISHKNGKGAKSMKKLFKRLAAAALATCMTMGLMVTGAGAYRWETEANLNGKMVQWIQDHDNEIYSLFIVNLLPVGSEVKFSENVNVYIYNEGAYGAYAPKLVQEKVTSFVIPDASHTYVFDDGNKGLALFRGSNGAQAPITLVGDFEENSTTLKLSKPVVDIKVEPLESYDYWEGTSSTGYYLTYYLAAGTQITSQFGAKPFLTDMWDAEGKEIRGEDFDKTVAEQFNYVPAAEEDGFGGPSVPITLDKLGYYYGFRPEALACNLPVFKVVEDPGTVITPRAANFSDMNWSKSYVEKVYGYGWMEGMGDKFDPEGNLTVAQAITLAARLYSTQRNEPIPTSGGAWYQSYVDYCLNNNLLMSYYNEYEGDTLEGLMAKMNDKISRADMLKILNGAVSIPGLRWDQEETVSIPDVDEYDDGGWIIYNWYRKGIVGGKDTAGNFMPNDSIKRGEVAVILCNLLGL